MGGSSELPGRAASHSTSSASTVKPKQEFVVLVTGFGPFPDGRGGHFSTNTSHLISKLLPSHLSVLNPFNPTSLPIRILNPTSPDGKYVKTEYAYVRKFVQELYDKYESEVDAIVHLGMANGWEWFSVEEKAFNERFSSNWWGEGETEGYYLVPDDEGKTVRDITEQGGKGIWDRLPLGLKAAGVNMRIVVDDVKKVVNYETEGCELEKDGGEENGLRREEKMKIDVISHDEAGNYCCGFIFYESLATCWKRKLNTRVVFCHVPGWTEPKRLERGADFVCAVIGAVCRQINPSFLEKVMQPE